MVRLVRPSWSSYHDHVRKYKTLLDKFEEAHRAYKAGEIKSWDLDGVIKNVREELRDVLDYLNAAYMYLWTCEPGELYSDWEKRTADMPAEDLMEVAEAYFQPTRVRARNRYEYEAKKERERKAEERKAAKAAVA